MPCASPPPGQIHLFHRLTQGTFLAATPPSDTDLLLAMVADLWPSSRADSVLQTTLQNGNPVIHPVVSLLNAGPVDRRRLPPL